MEPGRKMHRHRQDSEKQTHTHTGARALPSLSFYAPFSFTSTRTHTLFLSLSLPSPAPSRCGVDAPVQRGFHAGARRPPSPWIRKTAVTASVPSPPSNTGMRTHVHIHAHMHTSCCGQHARKRMALLCCSPCCPSFCCNCWSLTPFAVVFSSPMANGRQLRRPDLSAAEVSIGAAQQCIHEGLLLVVVVLLLLLPYSLDCVFVCVCVCVCVCQFG